MQVKLYRYQNGWNEEFDPSLDSPNTVLLMFGRLGRNPEIDGAAQTVCKTYPSALVAGCSSAGEIMGSELSEDSLVVAVMKLQRCRAKKAWRKIDNAQMSETIGKSLAKELMEDDLKAVLVISEGLQINGTELAKGLNEVLPPKVVVTGGLAGDDDLFEKTFVMANRCEPLSGAVTALGFYGDEFGVASGYQGGWDKFGIEREITASKKNVLYTLNNEPALQVYKRYLGKYTDELPASALLFPLAIRESKEDEEVKVRTVLAIDEETQSITFAGDMPEGGYATFMKANFDRLIDGAYEAAGQVTSDEVIMDALCVAISCVGRKLLLKQRTEEELEAVLDNLPQGTKQIGFYSYGEISPMHSGQCDLHNQTMTLTLYWEK